MADSVRDLVVSLSLNSDNFTKNIKTIGSQIKEAESDFKAAGAGVTNFESTLSGAQAKATMLAQKMQLQSQAVEQYQKALDAAKDKLNQSYQQHEKLSKTLEEAKQKYTEVCEAEGEGSDAAKAQAEEVAKLEGQLASVDRQMQNNANSVTQATTNLNNATAALRQTESELDKANSDVQRLTSAWTDAGAALQRFSTNCSEAGKKMTDAGQKLSMSITDPIVALGTAAVTAFNEVDYGLDTIIQKTGESGEALDGLNTSFRNIYGSMAVTAEDTGIAIGEVNTRFGLTGNKLERVSSLFLEFANINGVDLNSSIDDVDSIMTKFGVDTAEVANVLGYMTSVGQSTGISMNRITYSLKTNGASLKEMGFTLEESIALLAQFEANGVDASTAMMGIKRAVQSAAKDGKSADQALAETVLGIKNAVTETEALNLAIDLFGSRGAAEMASAIREGRINIDELTQSMAEYGTVVQDTYEATLDLPDQATVAMNNLKLAGADLADSMFASVGPVLTDLIGDLKQLIEQFGALDADSKQRIVKIAAVVAAAGPLLTIAGKLVTVVGGVTSALGSFCTAVASAGGGLKGLGSVLSSSPVFWAAVVTGVAVAIASLSDFGDEAERVKKELEQLEVTANEWQNNSAKTFYTTSKGLSAFGASASDFTTDLTDAALWLMRVTREWADNEVEADETVAAYTKSFKDMTESTRSSLKEMADTAKQAGYDEMYAQMQVDLKALDSVDARVEELLKKRQESFLNDEDIAELNGLIKDRYDIQVKYKLVEETSSGFDKIQDGVDSAIARAQSKGEKVYAEVYQDALVAAAEGYAALNSAIDTEYDERYALVKLMDDEVRDVNGLSEKQKAQAELDTWYAQQRQQAAEQYADTLGMVVDEQGRTLASTMLSTESVQNTYSSLGELFSLLDSFGGSADELSKINAIFDGMSESDLTEFIALLEQVRSLQEGGMSDTDISETLGLDASQVQMLTAAFDQLAGIQEKLQQYDTTKELDSLRSMFGEQLAEEVIKIATDLDLTGAKAAWSEFAEDPGAVVKTDAEVTNVTGNGKTYTLTNATIEAGATLTGVSGNGQSFTVFDAVINADGTLTGVDGEGKTFTATNCTVSTDGTLTGVDGNGQTFTVKNASVTSPATLTAVTGDGKTFVVSNAVIHTDGTLTGVDGEGKTFTATNCTVNADGTLTGVDGNGRTFTVSNVNVTAAATLTGVTGDGKTFTVSNAVIHADGTLTGVDGEGKTFTATNCTVNADGTLTGVDGNGQTFTVSNATVQSSANVLLNDLQQSVITDWQRKNASKVTITSPVGLPVEPYLGSDWQSDLLSLYNAGLIEVYGENGLPITVTPTVVGKLTGDAIVVGVDENGTYHVTVVPQFAGADKSDVQQSLKSADQAFDTLNEYMQERYDYFEKSSVGQFLQTFFTGYDIEEMDTESLKAVGDTITYVAAALQGGVDLSGIEGLGDALDTTAQAIHYWNTNGYNTEFITGLVDDLNTMGLDLKASDLYDYCMSLYAKIRSQNSQADYDVNAAEREAALAEQTARKEEERLAAQQEQSRLRAEAVAEAKAAEEAVVQKGLAADAVPQQYIDGMTEAMKVMQEFYDKLEEGVDDPDALWLDGGFAERWTENFSFIDEFDMGKLYQGLKEKAASKGEDALSEVQKSFMNLFEWMETYYGSEANTSDLGIDIMEGVEGGAIGYDWSNLASTTIGNLDAQLRAYAGAHSPATRFIPIGADIAEGIAAGITSGTSSVTSAIVALANAAVAAAKDALDIHSPSRVFADEVGAMAMAGFGEGVTDEAKNQGRIIRNAAKYLTGEAKNGTVSGINTRTYTYNTDASISFAGANFTVKDKTDVYALAQEIAALTKRQQTGRGAR